jgi:hypothetical protein
VIGSCSARSSAAIRSRLGAQGRGRVDSGRS